MEEEEEEGRNGKRADGDVKTSSPSEKTAGQGSRTTNDGDKSEGRGRVDKVFFSRSEPFTTE